MQMEPVMMQDLDSEAFSGQIRSIGEENRPVFNTQVLSTGSPYSWLFSPLWTLHPDDHVN